MKWPVKYGLLIVLITRFPVSAEAQHRSYSFYELYQLDSIGHSHSIGRYFGALYYDFLLLVEKALASSDSMTQRYIRHFEIVFARFYIDACTAFDRKEQVALPAWRAYFLDTTLQRAHYYLLGANAHLNGGLAEAIAGSYTAAEWKDIKKRYVLFNKCLNKTYEEVYNESIRTIRKAKLFSILTLGLSKPMGRYYLYKWRKRQMRLTETFYENRETYTRLLAKVTRKKNKIDRLITHSR